MSFNTASGKRVRHGNLMKLFYFICFTFPQNQHETLLNLDQSSQEISAEGSFKIEIMRGKGQVEIS